MTYTYDGGSGGPVSATYTVGGSPIVLPTPTETGYTFNGWFTASSGGSPVGAGGTLYTPTGSINLYAQWTANTYTVTYTYDGGSGGPVSATYTVGGSPIVLPTPTETGYTFNGWFTASSGGSPVGAGGTLYTPTGSINLYAQWTANTYTVTYTYDGGSGGPVSATYTVGGSPIVLPTPTETGYTFNGWFTASSGGSPVGAGGTLYTPTGSINLYAQWTANTYTVTYTYDGGSGGPVSATYTVGGSPIVLPTPTETGYTFNGWFTASSGGSPVGAGWHALHAHGIDQPLRPVDGCVALVEHDHLRCRPDRCHLWRGPGHSLGPRHSHQWNDYLHVTDDQCLHRERHEWRPHDHRFGLL